MAAESRNIYDTGDAIKGHSSDLIGEGTVRKGRGYGKQIGGGAS